jgi:excisionase family DNA binding protein
MPEDQIPNNGTPSVNPTEVRSEEPPENKAEPTETERKRNGNADARSDARSYTAKLAAQYIEKDEKTIRNWIKSGRIHAEKVRGAWQIPKSELDAALVNEVRAKDRKAEQEQGSARSSESPADKGQSETAEQETERKAESPTDTRSDVRYEAIEGQIKEQERIITEKDLRIADLKSAHEKQLTEKDQRLNDKTDRINDLRSDREKDRENYRGMIQNAQQLIDSLQSQVIQLEAPKPSVSSDFEAVEVESEPAQEEPEQGNEEPKKRPHWWSRSKN